MLGKLQRAHPTLRGHFAPAYLVGSNMLRAYLFFIYGLASTLDLVRDANISFNSGVCGVLILDILTPLIKEYTDNDLLCARPRQSFHILSKLINLRFII